MELNSEGLYQSSGKEKKKVVVLCPRPRQNVKLGTFTLWSCNKVQNSCCFANLNLLLFCLSRCRRRRCCLTGLSSLMMIAFVFRFCRYQKKSVKVIKICKGTGRGGGGEAGRRGILQSHIPPSEIIYENTASRHFFFAFPNLLGCFQKNNALTHSLLETLPKNAF